MPLNFETAYHTDPFVDLDQRERTWYDPLIQRWYRQSNVYHDLVPIKQDFSPQARTTRKVIYTVKERMEPMTNAVPRRQLYTDPMRSSSRQLVVTTERHVGKMQYHAEDDVITYWEDNPGRPGLSRVIGEDFAPAITLHMDTLARNAYCRLTRHSYANGRANWGELVAGDTFNLDWALLQRLTRTTRDISDWPAQQILCVTTPGALYSIQTDPDYRSQLQHTPQGWERLHTGVTLSWEGTQFAPTQMNVLWNAGAITKQVAITTAANALDGGHDWGPYIVGGSQSGNDHLKVSDFAAGQFKKGDIVTVHLRRADGSGVIPAYEVSENGVSEEIRAPFESGVAHGVDPYDGMTVQRQVVYVDATPGACKIGFDKPVTFDFNTDILARDGASTLAAPEGGNFQSNAVDVGEIYGYVTKALNIHCSIFVYGIGAITSAVTYMPRITTPAPVDDFGKMFRMSYDFQMGYREWNVDMAHVVYHTGPYSIDGTLNYNT